ENACRSGTDGHWRPHLPACVDNFHIMYGHDGWLSTLSAVAASVWRRTGRRHPWWGSCVFPEPRPSAPAGGGTAVQHPHCGQREHHGERGKGNETGGRAAVEGVPIGGHGRQGRGVAVE